MVRSTILFFLVLTALSIPYSAAAEKEWCDHALVSLPCAIVPTVALTSLYIYHRIKDKHPDHQLTKILAKVWEYKYAPIIGGVVSASWLALIGGAWYTRSQRVIESNNESARPGSQKEGQNDNKSKDQKDEHGSFVPQIEYKFCQGTKQQGLTCTLQAFKNGLFAYEKLCENGEGFTANTKYLTTREEGNRYYDAHRSGGAFKPVLDFVKTSEICDNLRLQTKEDNGWVIPFLWAEHTDGNFVVAFWKDPELLPNGNINPTYVSNAKAYVLYFLQNRKFCVFEFAFGNHAVTLVLTCKNGDLSQIQATLIDSFYSENRTNYEPMVKAFCEDLMTACAPS